MEVDARLFRNKIVILRWILIIYLSLSIPSTLLSHLPPPLPRRRGLTSSTLAQLFSPCAPQALRVSYPAVGRSVVFYPETFTPLYPKSPHTRDNTHTHIYIYTVYVYMNTKRANL